MVTNILLLLILGLLVTAGLLFWRAYRIVRAEYEAAKAQFLSFVTPPEEGKPSPLALAIDGAASVVGRAVIAQAKTTLMGMESGRVRGAKAIEGAIAEDQIGAAGGGALLGAFPALGRTLRRNPGLIDLALPFIQRLQSGSSSGKSGSPSGNGHQSRMNIGL